MPLYSILWKADYLIHKLLLHHRKVTHKLCNICLVPWSLFVKKRQVYMKYLAREERRIWWEELPNSPFPCVHLHEYFMYPYYIYIWPKDNKAPSKRQQQCLPAEYYKSMFTWCDWLGRFYRLFWMLMRNIFNWWCHIRWHLPDIVQISLTCWTLSLTSKISGIRQSKITK